MQVSEYPKAKILLSYSKLDFESEIVYYLKRGYEIAGFNMIYRMDKGTTSELFVALVVNTNNVK